MAVASDSTRLPGAGAFHSTLLRMRRRALEDWIERALSILDDLDGDPDLEGSPAYLDERIVACIDIDAEEDPAELSWQHDLRGGTNVRAA